MKKTLSVLLSAFLLFTADVLADDKIIVLNTASNNGTMFSQSTAYAEDFKNMGYDVEFVSPVTLVRLGHTYRKCNPTNPCL